MNGFFGEFLLSEKKGERISSRILIPNLFNFNSAVCKEIVEGEIVIATFEGFVMPENFKGENFPIIIEVLFQAIIWMSSS